VLRLLRLQKLIRRAVRARRTEEAALLARSAADAYLIGLYCLHSDDAVTKLSAANMSAARRATGYLVADGVVSQVAVDAALDAHGDRGRDPNLRDVAEWLAKEKSLSIAPALYAAYYMPLSHFYAHTNGFTLTRHVRPDDKLRRRPAPVWARRSAVRLADGCAGLLAAAIAEHSGQPPGLLRKYADAHIARMLTPVFVLAARGGRQSVRWQEVPAALRAVRTLRRYTRGAGQGDSPAEQEVRIREAFVKAFGVIIPDQDQVFQVGIGEAVARILREMSTAETGSAEGAPGTER
jgi:hypothetical protein